MNLSKTRSSNWSPWSEWSPCSEECMSGESQGRSRQCLDETGTSMADVVPCIEKVLTDILALLTFLCRPRRSPVYVTYTCTSNECLDIHKIE